MLHSSKSKLSVDGLTQFRNFRSGLWTLTWQNMLVQDHQLKDIFCRFEIFLKSSLPNLFQSYLSEIRMKTIVLFQAYDTSHRLDNSLLQITLNITLRSQNNKEQKYNNEAAPYLLTNWITLICVFTVCSCREGDLVFSRPLTRTQVNSHWTTIVWGQISNFIRWC